MNPALLTGGGLNSSVGNVLGLLSCVMRCGFDPPLSFWLSIPKKILSDVSINRGLVCAHVHSITWTQKILTFMS